MKLLVNGAEVQVTDVINVSQLLVERKVPRSTWFQWN